MSQRTVSVVSVAGLQFTTRELRDLLAAWVAMGLAFTFFLFGPRIVFESVDAATLALAISLVTVGVGFLLHELAHKVVAIRFGQVAHFRADYGMLFVALMSGLAGFLFAAPGAVHHRGRITPRENGLIALAGPVSNLVLLAGFGAIFLATEATNPGGVVSAAARLGMLVNAFLAAFNMLPYGPLDGRTVWRWSKIVFLLVAVPSGALVVFLFLELGGLTGGLAGGF